jgi:glycosyltransferase involved in cell wall biosynthesis
MRQWRVAAVMGSVIPEQLELWRAVKEMGVSLTIIGTDQNIYRGRWPWDPRKPPDIESILLRPLSPAVEKGHLWWAYRGLSSALRRARPQIIHVVSEPWGALVSQALLVRPRDTQRARVCVHGADNIFVHGGRIERSTRRLILSFVWPRIDGFASWSGAGIDAARQNGLSRLTPTAVVPAIVPDPDSFSNVGDKGAARSTLGLPIEEPVVGYLGRLDEEKGIDDLLEAMRILGASAPFLSVWGSGAKERHIRGLISSGGIRGSFGGALALQEVPLALQACDVLAVPSRTTPEWKEQFGRVVLEAMLAECAVVAYRSGAIPEVLGEAGVLVEEGDVSGLAASIQRLVADPVRRSDLAVSARAEALHRFRPQALAKRLVNFWSEVVSG